MEYCIETVTMYNTLEKCGFLSHRAHNLPLQINSADKG